MNKKSASVQTAAGIASATRTAYSQKWSFLALFVFMLFVSTTTAASLDLLPNPRLEVPVESASLAASAVEAATAPELPTKIEIPSIGISEIVSNPESTDIVVLDRALLTGPVRYPSSSKLGEEGNLIMFGHSSYLPIVNNKAFKAFDDIQKLNKGDRIVVTGESHTFVYAVETVENKSAIDDYIPLDVEGSKLTLATCDSFGTKSDRFVVTATLIETRAL